MLIPIIFIVSVKNPNGTGFLYNREELIDENHSMSAGERNAWCINGQATEDLQHYDKQGIIWEEGNRYFNNVHVHKEIGNIWKHYKSSIPPPQRQTADTWVDNEWVELNH